MGFGGAHIRDIVVFLDMDVLGSTPDYVEAARSLGLRPLLMSSTPWVYRDIAAASAIRMREMTVDSIVDAIDRIGRDTIAGVFTPRSQRAVLAAQVAQTIGRPHADPAAIAVCHHKLEARRLLQSKGFVDVEFRHVTTAEEAAAFSRQKGGCAVLKPLTSSGSSGVRVCTTPEEVREHAGRLLRNSGGGILIEEVIRGPMFGVETFDGRALGVRGLHVSDHPSPAILGQDVPAAAPASVCKALMDHAEDAVRLVGIDRGIASVQMIYAGDRPHVIEINPRLPAGFITLNVKAAFGFDMARLCLSFACGLSDEIETLDWDNPKHTSVTWHLLRRNGPVRAIAGVEDARRVPGVVTVGVLPALFRLRADPAATPQRVAYVHAVAETAERASESVHAALGKLIQIPEKPFRSWWWKRRTDLMQRLRYGRAR